MNFFGHEPSFWMAIAGATVVKIFTTPYQSLMRTVITVIAAVFSAMVFTDPVLAWLRLDPTTYKAAVAAVLALTGEGLMRFAMGVASDPTKALDWLRAWRGGK